MEKGKAFREKIKEFVCFLITNRILLLKSVLSRREKEDYSILQPVPTVQPQKRNPETSSDRNIRHTEMMGGGGEFLKPKNKSGGHSCQDGHLRKQPLSVHRWRASWQVQKDRVFCDLWRKMFSNKNANIKWNLIIKTLRNYRTRTCSESNSAPNS